MLGCDHPGVDGQYENIRHRALLPRRARWEQRDVQCSGQVSQSFSAEIHLGRATIKLPKLIWNQMDPKLPPGLEHIRLMEARIEQQTATIEELRRSGQDTSAAVNRLNLLQRALEEIRIQLDSLSLTEMDAKRSAIAAALTALTKSGKSS